MQSIQYTVHGSSVILETAQGWLSLEAYTDCIIRVRLAPSRPSGTSASLIVQGVPAGSVPLTVSETEDTLICSTGRLSININRKTSAFTYLDSIGQLLTKEPDAGGKTLIPIDVLKSVFDDTTQAQIRKDADGVNAYAAPARQIVDRTAYHTKLAFEWQPDEALYGLGSHEEGMFNLRGQHQYLYQQNMKVSIPVLLSTRGYAVLWDCTSLMTFHDDAFGSYVWTDVDDALDYYFIYGPEFDQLIGSIRYLTGQAPMLPRWAFGYIQSKERYHSQEELIGIAREYRSRNLPIDCIVQDWKSWPQDLWGQKTLDPERFPDPDGMVRDLHHLNTRLMISIWPIMNPGGENWHEMRDQGYLLGNQATYDAFNEKARDLYWKQMNDGLFRYGIDAWWCDCTEPFQTDWRGAHKPEPEERLRMNTEEAKRYLDPEYISAYSLLHSKGIYENQRRTSEDKRVVNLTRSAYAGQQRYSTITWSGDVSATWETLRRQIADGLNFCATGLPYWTTDVGAFFVRNDPKLWFWDGDFDRGVADMGYRELYLRWFQFGTFLPMFRSHGTDTPRELWRFGDSGDPIYEALVRFLRLRYRLLPYIYSVAGRVTHEHYTMMRSLPFDFRNDPDSYNVSDQYLFGPAFLVNPVTEPMYFTAGSVVLEDNSRTRSVYLPKGSDWYDFWTGRRFSGGQTICADAALDTMPLFIRSGSIVPLGPEVSYADEQPNAALQMWVYPGQDGQFVLYEDEGDNYNYEQGQFAMIRFSWDDANHCLTLHNREGRYPGMSETREFQIVLGAGSAYAPTAQIKPAQTVIYTGQEVHIQL